MKNNKNINITTKNDVLYNTNANILNFIIKNPNGGKPVSIKNKKKKSSLIFVYFFIKNKKLDIDHWVIKCIGNFKKVKWKMLIIVNT